MFMINLLFYLYSQAVENGCSLLTAEWKTSDERTMHVNNDPFKFT